MPGTIITRKMKDGFKKIESLGQLSSNEITVSVLHWNVLCQALANSFDKVPENQLTWQFRRPLIEQQLFCHDEIVWDFICLQEVDRHRELFNNEEAPADDVTPTSSIENKRNCYKGETAMKSDGMMGCAIFYNSQKYECLEFKKIPFLTEDNQEMNQLYVYGSYRHIKAGTIVHVATTHLKAKKGFEDMRAAQANQLVKGLVDLENLILTGDFNDVFYSKALAEVKPHLNNASEMAHGAENEFTTWKYREPHMTIRTIDYVFTSKASEGTGVNRYLALPEKKLVPEQGNPNENHPSDHYALGYEFTFAKAKQCL